MTMKYMTTTVTTNWHKPAQPEHGRPRRQGVRYNWVATKTSTAAPIKEVVKKATMESMEEDIIQDLLLLGRIYDTSKRSQLLEMAAKYSLKLGNLRRSTQDIKGSLLPQFLHKIEQVCRHDLNHFFKKERLLLRNRQTHLSIFKRLVKQKIFEEIMSRFLQSLPHYNLLANKPMDQSDRIQVAKDVTPPTDVQIDGVMLNLVSLQEGPQDLPVLSIVSPPTYVQIDGVMLNLINLEEGCQDLPELSILSKLPALTLKKIHEKRFGKRLLRKWSKADLAKFILKEEIRQHLKTLPLYLQHQVATQGPEAFENEMATSIEEGRGDKLLKKILNLSKQEDAQAVIGTGVEECIPRSVDGSIAVPIMDSKPVLSLNQM